MLILALIECKRTRIGNLTTKPSTWNKIKVNQSSLPSLSLLLFLPYPSHLMSSLGHPYPRRHYVHRSSSKKRYARTMIQLRSMEIKLIPLVNERNACLHSSKISIVTRPIQFYGMVYFQWHVKTFTSNNIHLYSIWIWYTKYDLPFSILTPLGHCKLSSKYLWHLLN